MTAQHEDVDAVPAPAGSASAGNRPKWVVPVGIALTLVLVCALAATVWFGIRVVSGFMAERGITNAVEAAKVAAVNLTTFDSGTADADTKRLIDGSTAEYGSTFAGDQSTVVQNLHKGQVRSTGTVTEAGVLSYNSGTSTAHVLVTVRAQVANIAAPGGQARDYHFELTMVDQGKWLLNDVEFVG